MSNYKTLPDTGFVRLASITWWQGVKDGCFPKPVKLGVKTTAWRVEDIREKQVLNSLFPIMIRDRMATQAIFEMIKNG